MQGHARRIAQTYRANKGDWKQAAKDIRQPYWDFAANSVPPDEVITLTRVKITVPDGRRIDVTNPLHHYTFQSRSPFGVSTSDEWVTTRRYPTFSTFGVFDDTDRLKACVPNHCFAKNFRLSVSLP